MADPTYNLRPDQARTICEINLDEAVAAHERGDAVLCLNWAAQARGLAVALGDDDLLENAAHFMQRATAVLRGRGDQ